MKVTTHTYKQKSPHTHTNKSVITHTYKQKCHHTHIQTKESINPSKQKTNKKDNKKVTYSWVWPCNVLAATCADLSSPLWSWALYTAPKLPEAHHQHSTAPESLVLVTEVPSCSIWEAHSAEGGEMLWGNTATGMQPFSGTEIYPPTNQLYQNPFSQNPCKAVHRYW